MNGSQNYIISNKILIKMIVQPHHNYYEKRLQGTGGFLLAIYEPYYQQKMTTDAKNIQNNENNIRNGRSQIYYKTSVTDIIKLGSKISFIILTPFVDHERAKTLPLCP